MKLNDGQYLNNKIRLRKNGFVKKICHFHIFIYFYIQDFFVAKARTLRRIFITKIIIIGV